MTKKRTIKMDPLMREARIQSGITAFERMDRENGRRVLGQGQGMPRKSYNVPGTPEAMEYELLQAATLKIYEELKKGEYLGPKKVKKRRECLHCEKKFKSWGIENRICQKCRDLDKFKDGIVDAIEPTFDKDGNRNNPR